MHFNKDKLLEVFLEANIKVRNPKRTDGIPTDANAGLNPVGMYIGVLVQKLVTDESG